MTIQGVTEEQLQCMSQAVRADLANLIDTWQWDSRNAALQGVFSVDKAEAVQQVLSQHFSGQWDKKAFKTAPEELKQQAGSYAQLDKTQQLFTQAEHPELLLAWWPWGHGATISVRFFKAYTSEYKAETGLFSRIKQILA